MFMMRLEKFDILADAVFLFSEIAYEADVKFSPSLFSLIASNHSLDFIATMQMRCEQPQFFPHHSVGHNLSSRISLHSFHRALWDGGSFSSMTIHVPQDITTMNLTFHTSGDAPQLRRELILSPSQEENLGQIKEEKCFSIDLQNFRRIIREVASFQNNSICVTLTNSQVKFSIASMEIILTQESGQCEIEGFEGEVETQFRISLHPMLFFLTMTYRAEDRVWFYKTIDDSYCVIVIPSFGINADYVIYFPQM